MLGAFGIGLAIGFGLGLGLHHALQQCSRPLSQQAGLFRPGVVAFHALARQGGRRRDRGRGLNTLSPCVCPSAFPDRRDFSLPCWMTKQRKVCCMA